VTSRARQPLHRVLDDRFELIENRPTLWPRLMTCGIGRDRETGKIVRVYSRGRRIGWSHYVDLESLAREVAKLGLPWIVPVLHAGPGLAFSEPPPVSPRGPMRREAAAACVFAACEVLAHLHALGAATRTAETSFMPIDLRVDGAHARIAWFIPGITGSEKPSEGDLHEWYEYRDLAPIAADLRGLVRLFFQLCPGVFVEPLASDPQRVALETLRELHEGRLSSSACTSVAGLARLIAELAPGDWTARIVALPVVDTLPPRRLDYDGVIADGEAELAFEPIDHVNEVALDWDFQGREGDEYIAVPLATAYHQRACGSFARGDLSAALADVERARQLDDFPPYRTTLAAVLDALNRGSEARAVIAAALAEWRSCRQGDPPSEVERARAHAMRGAFALRDGDLALAESDLRRAFRLDPTATHAHHLGAALYARGNLIGARAAESRSVELAPDNPRYRWALAVTLHELGRVNEARAHAREAVARDPAYRERLLRRFGRP
jgi:Flp pilus assembly protein TadD